MDASSHRHPLKRRELLSGRESRVCGLCGKEVRNGPAYECSQCYFTAHLHCAENPPPLVIDKRKIHEHTLTLLPRHVTFICNACGGCSGDKSPYVCLKCSFMIHGDCIEFPRVIKISRHNHRLAHNFFVGPREWKCGVCRGRVDGRYGSYTCVKGCDYAVHLKCATRGDVWDEKELEGVPEEVEDIVPFEVICDGLTVHFSHKHGLRLQNNKDMIRDVLCSACSFLIASSPFYRCQQCDFFLHVTCANLPRKIQTFLHVHPLTLCTEDERSGGPNGLSRCRACNLLYNGFRYSCLMCKDDHIEFDVRCSSVSEPFDYTLHPHPLFFYPGTRLSSCSLCNQHTLRYLLACLECDFKLCFTCATSPHKVNYKYDEHLLNHTIGEDVTTNPYWCDICENKIEEMSIHYKCSDCGPVLHNECALGSFRNMRPGFSFIKKHGHKYEVILNDRTSLLRCSQCNNDCHEPLLLMSTNTTTNDTIYLCSSTCFDTYVSV